MWAPRRSTTPCRSACVEGIAALARATTSAEAAAAYRGEQLTFGADYLIPKPFDPRLSGVVSTAVARAAMESGVAMRPLDDLDAYRRTLDEAVYKSALLMRPVFEAASTAARRIVFAEGEDERVLRAAQAILEETPERPILIGRPEVIERRCERLGLDIRPTHGLRDRESRKRSALSRLLGNLSPDHVPPRRHARSGPRHHAHQHHRHRRRHGASRRGRQPALRQLRRVSLASELRHSRFWATRRTTRTARCP